MPFFEPSVQERSPGKDTNWDSRKFPNLKSAASPLWLPVPAYDQEGVIPFAFLQKDVRGAGTADYIFNDNKNVQYLDGVAASKMAAEFSGDVMKCTVKGKLPSPDSKEYKTTAVLEYDEYGNIKRKIAYGEQGGIVAYEYEYEYRFYDETGE